ncbi:hypothetical protein K0817_015975 [Microbacterium sp. HD4P20]|uniref:hypothetical protein n=1 Tax=Microbacterium sp. HD4P20 TaxID=2864874 RepID=UPI001C644A6E|nr:hypothetical protein [Microbacterium sp. HD4P20]MCP2638052.1 hypothetical protein [Microbacterium sp. HD4P20]
MALAASLIVAPLVATSASATEDADLVGVVGEWENSTSETNKESYWEERYKEFNAVCYSHASDGGAHGGLSDGKKTVTLKPFQQGWPGDEWVVLVVKGGNEKINVIERPTAGVAYASPLNGGGQQADVSHWIVCKGDAPEEDPTEPTIVTPTLEFTEPSCDAAGEITKSDNVLWTSAPGADGSTVWTATPKDGTKFAPNAKTEWTVPALDQLPASHEDCRPDQPPAVVTTSHATDFDCESVTATVTTTTTTTPYVWNGEAWVPGTATEEVTTAEREMTADEKMDCPLPDTKVEYTAWEDGEWECGDTQVTQTREVTTTVYEYDQQGNPTPSSSTVVETQDRDLTQEEIAECPLLPGEIGSVCIGDVPYLGYEVLLPEGYEVDSETPVRITFVNPDGEDYVVENQPLAGTLLWPGASATAPKMWPGWALVDGEYVQTEGNYAWTREGVAVEFHVNPDYETAITYPEATALCANPPIGGGDPTPTPSAPPALAVTGADVSPVVPIAGGAALLLGLAALAIAAYRRKVTS